jgi:hypothetical protein
MNGPASLLAASCNDHSITLFSFEHDWQSPSIRFRFTEHSHNIPFLDLSPCGKYLASCSIDNSFIIWSTETGSVLQQYQSTIPGFLGSLWSVLFIQKSDIVHVHPNSPWKHAFFQKNKLFSSFLCISVGSLLRDIPEALLNIEKNLHESNQDIFSSQDIFHDALSEPESPIEALSKQLFYTFQHLIPHYLQLKILERWSNAYQGWNVAQEYRTQHSFLPNFWNQNSTPQEKCLDHFILKILDVAGYHPVVEDEHMLGFLKRRGTHLVDYLLLNTSLKEMQLMELSRENALVATMPSYASQSPNLIFSQFDRKYLMFLTCRIKHGRMASFFTIVTRRKSTGIHQSDSSSGM